MSSLSVFPWKNNPPKAWKEATLVLAAHGSSKHPMGAKAVNIHAKTIKKACLFKAVRTAFWKEAPRLSEALNGVSTTKTYIVPVLASRGYITNEVLPKELGFQNSSGDENTIICSPIGTHSLLPSSLAKACESSIISAGLNTSKTSILLVGHGNATNPASAQQTELVAEYIRQNTSLNQVSTAYLDQEPQIENWRDLVSNPDVLTIPFMISGGLHSAHDIPLALGILSHLENVSSLEDSQQLLGPYPSGSGQNLWYTRPIGCEPFITDLILDQVYKSSHK
ncbi:MAG: hypothetical protein OQJ97_11555 [Rhodospirillales bacterium]|nr:hypothetical protein [Rhodospirillales bacterium]